ncbi:MAG: biotin--[acetyl-CoA-carboxylase] ligase [Candidatus Babeliales bacterium]
MIIGSKIFHKKSCYNSIEWAKENIEIAADGSIFLADIHEYTHGRQDRIWQSDLEQIKVSILLKPEILSSYPEQILSTLNMALTLSIFDTLKNYNLELNKIELKWPNDFMYQNKKIGGVLFNLVWQETYPKAIIFSFAINVNNTFTKSNELYNIATSLKQILNKDINKQALFTNLIKNIDKYYQKWLNLEFDNIYNLWSKNQNYIGKKIKIHNFDKTISYGLFKDVLQNGDMVFVDDQNNQEKIISFYVIEQIDF